MDKVKAEKVASSSSKTQDDHHEKTVGSGYKSRWNTSFQLGVLKRVGGQRRGERKGQKGWKKSAELRAAPKEWEKLRDDATCPGKRSSFVSLVVCVLRTV